MPLHLLNLNNPNGGGWANGSTSLVFGIVCLGVLFIEAERFLLSKFLILLTSNSVCGIGTFCCVICCAVSSRPTSNIKGT